MLVIVVGIAHVIAIVIVIIVIVVVTVLSIGMVVVLICFDYFPCIVKKLVRIHLPIHDSGVNLAFFLWFWPLDP